MSKEFVGERIEVETSSRDGMPVSFVWRGRKYAIDSIEGVWQDWGFPLGRAPRKQGWRARKHRNCYVLASKGRGFEVYRDRRRSNAWILLKTWEKGVTGEYSGLPETGS